ncbi:MAG: GGDEF domain-containing protein [Bacillota bacterium]|nr:GGDEF domain-containing protein [Bacillota bacterium]
MEWLLCLAAVTVAVLLILSCREGGLPAETDRLTPLTEGWYMMADGEQVELRLPAEIPAEEGEDLVLFNDSLTDEDGGKLLSIGSALYRPQLHLGDQTLFVYDDEAFPRNQQMRIKLNCIGTLPASPGGQTLTLTYANIGNASFSVPVMYLGDSAALLLHHFTENLFHFLMALTMAILGIAALLAKAFFTKHRLGDPRFIHIGCFLLLCGVWRLLETPFFPAESRFYPVDCCISLYVSMLLAVPILQYVRMSASRPLRRALNACILAFYLNAAVQGLLALLDVFALSEMLFVTHFLLAATVAVSGAALLKGPSKQRSLLLAFAALGLSSLLAMLLYWLLKISWYDLLIELGILVFVAILLWDLLRTVAENFHFRAEAEAYRRLSLEDPLTGLKNRRAFNEFLEELAQTAGNYRNVALVFMSMKDLKSTNDSSGHKAGDELLIGTAQCIKRALSPYGECYRLGGDEFCAVLPDPPSDPARWHTLLEQELDRYNCQNRHKISVACGVSYLRNKAGELKTFSNWKFEADQRMCRDRDRGKDGPAESRLLPEENENGGDS